MSQSNFPYTTTKIVRIENSNNKKGGLIEHNNGIVGSANLKYVFQRYITLTGGYLNNDDFIIDDFWLKIEWFSQLSIPSKTYYKAIVDTICRDFKISIEKCPNTFTEVKDIVSIKQSSDYLEFVELEFENAFGRVGKGIFHKDGKILIHRIELGNAINLLQSLKFPITSMNKKILKNRISLVIPYNKNDDINIVIKGLNRAGITIEEKQIPKIIVKVKE